MVKKKYILFYFVFFISGISYSQDIHFSQFNASPLNLNPALTGNFNGNYRFCENFKNQWQSITVPYRTFSSSIEKKIILLKNNFGVGLLFNNDKAGDSDFGTTQIKFSLSYGRFFSGDSSFAASIGLNVAYNQNSINYNNLYFGNQFNGGQFDPDIPSNENFSNYNFNYIDYSAGINLIYLINKRIPLNFGIGFLHINKPTQSFINQQLSNLDRKYNFHISSELKMKDNLSFIPEMVYYVQGKFKEFDYGGLFKNKLNNVSFHNLYLGGWYRQGDAIVAVMSMDYQNINIGLSYDINTSNLRTASNGFGGFELSLIYIFYKKHPFNIPIKKQCPSFI